MIACAVPQVTAKLITPLADAISMPPLLASASLGLLPQRAGRMRQTLSFGEQQIELAAQPLALMAQVGALMRECVLEERLASEVLEIRVIDLALARPLVG
jgi:hypothetical protein